MFKKKLVRVEAIKLNGGQKYDINQTKVKRHAGVVTIYIKCDTGRISG